MASGGRDGAAYPCFVMLRYMDKQCFEKPIGGAKRIFSRAKCSELRQVQMTRWLDQVFMYSRALYS